MKWRNFFKGEPNNKDNEDCVTMNEMEGKWKDEKCEITKPFLCEYCKWVSFEITFHSSVNIVSVFRLKLPFIPL